MAISLHDELDTLYDKFDQAERKWLNRFEDLEGHFETAVKNFTANLPKGSGASTTAQDTVDFGSNVALAGMALSAGPAVIAVPIVVGLKKLASLVDGAEVKPPEPDILSFRNRFKDIKKSFKLTTEHIGDEIIKLKDVMRALGAGANEQFIRQSISDILLSPLWYPPPSSVTANPGLARALEMRLWFAYFNQLMKLSWQKVLFGGINYSPMWKHFKEMGHAPNGMSYMSIAMPGAGIVWIAKGDAADNFRKLNAHGEKNKELKLQHSYPADVQKYLALTKAANFANSFFKNGQSLPHSNLRWADVTI